MVKNLPFEIPGDLAGPLRLKVFVGRAAFRHY